jgi:hypothetical protein
MHSTRTVQQITEGFLIRQCLLCIFMRATGRRPDNRGLFTSPATLLTVLTVVSTTTGILLVPLLETNRETEPAFLFKQGTVRLSYSLLFNAVDDSYNIEETRFRIAIAWER